MNNRNPWLDVPAEDYEGHMDHPDVDQLNFLSRLLADALRDLRPEALAVPGSAMGTGFEHIDPEITLRVLAVDIQLAYLKILQDRHGDRLSGLETACADLRNYEVDSNAFDLVFAALIFEYLEPEPLLQKFTEWLRPGGWLVSVLQLPAKGHGKVSATPFEGVRVLEPIIHLLNPEDLKKLAASKGLGLVQENIEVAAAGKEFHVATFIREP
jgi:SAM-dependent methyltransferase